jgi:hypothetical protein
LRMIFDGFRNVLFDGQMTKMVLGSGVDAVMFERVWAIT